MKRGFVFCGSTCLEFQKRFNNKASYYLTESRIITLAPRGVLVSGG